MLYLRRAYEQASPEDGTRVLIDRLWPRGVKKTEAKIDWWPKELAPSAELRKWFGHDPDKFTEFAERYRQEIGGKAALTRLKELADKETVTLVYAAKDEAHNNAVVLKDWLA